MMKFIYLTNSRLPGEKAHAIQIMKTCAALAADVDIQIVHPRRVNRPWLQSVVDLQKYYRLPRDVERRLVYSLDLFSIVPSLPFGKSLAYKVVFAIQTITYHIALLPLLLTSSADVYYTRDSLTAALLVLLRKARISTVIYESHTFPSSRLGLRLSGWLVNKLDGIVVLTNLLATRYLELGVPEKRVSVVPDAVDLQDFGVFSKSAARHHLSIDENLFVVMYVGHMYHWKGVDTLVEAASQLSDNEQIWLVGGTPEELPRIEQLIKQLEIANIHLVGYVPYEHISTYMAAADVLVIPNSGDSDISRFYTSPIKLFEYMAAKRPIIASNLPSLREIIEHDETALLVQPDNPSSLAIAIQRLRSDLHLSSRLVDNATVLVSQYTWSRRSKRILDFVKSVISISSE
ncbi:MAG: glycosyltransferase family 4 protein [Anaerolineales bacterium]